MLRFLDYPSMTPIVEPTKFYSHPHGPTIGKLVIGELVIGDFDPILLD